MKFISKKRSLFASLSMVMLLGISNFVNAGEFGREITEETIDFTPVINQITIVQGNTTDIKVDTAELLRRTATSSSTIGQLVERTSGYLGTPTDTPSDLDTTGIRTAFGALRFIINAIKTINANTPGSLNTNLERILKLLGADGTNTVLGQLNGLVAAMGDRSGSTVFLRLDDLGKSVTDTRTSIETILGDRRGSTVFLRLDGLGQSITDARDTVLAEVDVKATEIETILGDRRGSTVFLRFDGLGQSVTDTRTSIETILGNRNGSTVFLRIKEVLDAVAALGLATGTQTRDLTQLIKDSRDAVIKKDDDITRSS